MLWLSVNFKHFKPVSVIINDVSLEASPADANWSLGVCLSAETGFDSLWRRVFEICYSLFCLYSSCLSCTSVWCLVSIPPFSLQLYCKQSRCIRSRRLPSWWRKNTFPPLVALLLYFVLSHTSPHSTTAAAEVVTAQRGGQEVLFTLLAVFKLRSIVHSTMNILSTIFNLQASYQDDDLISTRLTEAQLLLLLKFHGALSSYILTWLLCLEESISPLATTFAKITAQGHVVIFHLAST